MAVKRFKPSNYTTSGSVYRIERATTPNGTEPETPVYTGSSALIYGNSSVTFTYPNIDIASSAISKMSIVYRACSSTAGSGPGQIKLVNTSTSISAATITLTQESDANTWMHTAGNCISYDIPSGAWSLVLNGSWGIQVQGTYNNHTNFTMICLDIEYNEPSDFRIGANQLRKAFLGSQNIKRIFKGATLLFEQRLPDAYQQVTFIGLDGNNSGASSTPYIDTGIVPSATKGFFLDAYFSGGSSGSSSGANGKTMMRSLGDYVQLYWNGDTAVKNQYVRGRHVWTIDYYNHKVGYDNTLETISDPSVGYASPSFLIGAWGEWGSAYYGMAGRVYGFKAYDSGTLIADYLPCYRKSDGVIGFYDTISGSFLVNAGSGSFTKGFDVDENLYQEVEYIEGTGTQYINTGFRHNQNTRFFAEIDFDPQSAWVSAFGSWGGSNGSVAKFFGAEYNGSGLSAYYYSSGSLYQFPSSSFMGRKIWNLNKNDWTIGSSSHVFSTGTFSSDYNDIIFGNMSYRGVPGAYSRMKVYMFKIYDNGTLVRDYIPCYRKSDGEIGLYDAVNRVFYTNQGNGDFVKGFDINDSITYQEVEYIKSTGTQYLDLGYLVDDSMSIEIDFAHDGSTIDCERLFGSFSGSPVEFVRSGTSNDFYVVINNTGVSSVISISEGTKYSLALTNSNIKINDSVVSSWTAQSYSSSDGLQIFHSYDRYGNFRIYSVKVIQGGTDVKLNLVPCYKIASGDIGLYDTINGVFYMNSGSGDFTKGPNV